MVKQDNLTYRLGFRADDQTLEGLEGLTAKFGCGQSEVIRLGIKRLMESYLNVESDVLIIDRSKFDEINSMFIERIKLLDRQQSRTMQVLDKLLEQPGVKKALKSVKREDIEQ